MNFHRRLQSTEGLKFLWLELTSKCNLECVHCYADSSPASPLHETMTLGDWKSALAEARDLGCRSVQFIGGEPTLYPGLAELIAWARTREFKRVEVYTNGLHFTRSLRDAFVKHRVNLAFSVYSSEASVHDVITGRKGSLNRTLASIRWAVAEKLPVRVGIISMEANKGHQQRTREVLAALGVTDMGPDRVRGIGRGAQMRGAVGSPYQELCGSCSNGRLCITPSGQLYPCVFSRFCPVGTFADGLRNAVHSAALRDFRLSLQASVSSASECAPELPEPEPDVCPPEEPAGPCPPEEPAGPCPPEEPAGPCPPEEPAGPCPPEEPAGPCNPEIPPPDCRPETPSDCRPADTA